MAEFIRVRDKDTKHEYDAPVGEVEVNSGLYTVLDKEPVSAPRPVVYFSPNKRGKSVGDSNEGEG